VAVCPTAAQKLQDIELNSSYGTKQKM